MIRVYCKFFIFIFCFIFKAETFDVDNYGPYELKWVKFNMCKGSKPTCGKIEISNLHNASDIIYTVTMYRDCVIGKIGMAMSITTEIDGRKSTSEYLKYNINKPCEHFMAGPVIKEAYGSKAFEKCIMPKGKHVKHFDIKGLTQKLLGSKFFYGTFSFRTIIYNKKYLISCNEAVVIAEKIK